MSPTPFDVALARLCRDAAQVDPGTERVELEFAVGRVLAVDTQAPIAVPGFANSAMDGYAVRVGSPGVRVGQQFRCVDLALAGAAAQRLDDAEQCTEIATGAVLPDGADTVLPYESTRRCADAVVASKACAWAANVRSADDDYARGMLALRAGRVLDAGALGVLASFGLREIGVRRRPRIAVIVTGSELMPAGVDLALGQIHDSNSTMLRALLVAHAEQLSMIGPVADRVEDLRDALAAAAAAHDIVISAGGASAGRADFVPQIVRELGEIRVWKVATRPGMPFLYGAIGEAVVYALPGNPVSVFASLLTLVIPALAARAGRAPAAKQYAVLATHVAKAHARLEWRRGWLASAADGRRVITAHPAAGSGMLRGVAESNALLRIAAETRRLGAGAVVEVLPFPSCL